MTSDTKKSIQKTVNKVRETASAEYQANVPVLKDNNLPTLIDLSGNRRKVLVRLGNRDHLSFAHIHPTIPPTRDSIG